MGRGLSPNYILYYFLLVLYTNLAVDEAKLAGINCKGYFMNQTLRSRILTELSMCTVTGQEY